MSVKLYAPKFTKLSRYALSLVIDPCAKMSKFISGIFDLIVKECRSAMLVKEIDISRLMTYPEQTEGKKLKGEQGERVKGGSVRKWVL